MPSRDAQKRAEAQETRKSMYNSVKKGASAKGYTVYPYIYTAGKGAPAPGKRYAFAVIKGVAEIENDADAAELKAEALDKPLGEETHSGIKFHVFEKEPEFAHVWFRSRNYTHPEIAMQNLFQTAEAHFSKPV